MLIGIMLGALTIGLVGAAGSRDVAVLAFGLVMLGLATWLITAAPAQQTLRLALTLTDGQDPPPALPSLTLLVGLAAAGGIAVGWVLQRFISFDVRPPPASPSPPAASPYDPATLQAAHRKQQRIRDVWVLAPCLILGAASAAFGTIGLARGLLFGLFAAGASIASLELREALTGDDPIELRSSWGGLGGGLGGWEVSRPLLLLLLAMVFAGAALVAAIPPAPGGQPSKSESPNGIQTSTAGQPAGAADKKVGK